MNAEEREIFGTPIDNLSLYSPWDQAMAGYIVGRLMLAGLLSVTKITDEDNVTRAMCIVARSLAAIPPASKDEWPLER